VNRTQFVVLFFDSFGDELDEVIAQHGHRLDLGSEEGGGGCVHKAQELVAVRAGHDQHQSNIAGTV